MEWLLKSNSYHVEKISNYLFINTTVLLSPDKRLTLEFKANYSKYMHPTINSLVLLLLAVRNNPATIACNSLVGSSVSYNQKYVKAF